MRVPNSCSATPRFRIQTCNLLKARVVVRTGNHHARLLSPEPFGWLVPPKSTRAWEPTLLWNHYNSNPNRERSHLREIKSPLS